jgi:alkylation response protein AidB-like acyl-CoA dehydrogenase
VEFAFTDDQLAFRDAVRAVLERECPPSVVRAAWTNADGRSGAAWKALGEMGVLGALVPEDSGGLGLTELDVVLLAEETGRAALPEPFVEHVLVCAPLLRDAGDRTFSAGEQLVPYAATADALVVDGTLAQRPDVELTERASVDGSRRPCEVTVGSPQRTLSDDERTLAFDRAALGTAAQLLGLAQQMLDMTVAYTVERKQFGVAIGSFQALKHKLADVRIALEFARPLVYRAAASLADGDDRASVDVSMAKAQASEAALLAARHALQCHGAIGYSYEHDLHLWMKRAWALAAAWGDAAWHREHVARAILDPTS